MQCLFATGSWTADHGLVMGHNTMFDYTEAVANVVLDLVPTKGQHILMQTQPGFIHSGTDFFLTGAGLVGCETTIGQFSSFDTNGIPEFTRFRRATQDTRTITEWCDVMRRGNNGGYANAWLLGDANTGEIARLELGLKYVAFESTKDGYFAGSNVAKDHALLRLETERSLTDIRESAGARRVRWKQLLAENKGRITAAKAKQFLADGYDVYLRKHQPGGRSLSGPSSWMRRSSAGRNHSIPRAPSTAKSWTPRWRSRCASSAAGARQTASLSPPQSSCGRIRNTTGSRAC